ncbi:unnamed protein product [Euphydryas editha]|uniref:Tc1-like transposase DDE domain-containing protein n=1 Tax=Euphydryas editha TaxID=104508 RepID=A0AAU9TMJ0_EUPED|nr:unnamed protein product [Euphydryas editha]
MFSDESRFYLYTHEGSKRVYRRPGELYKQSCIKENLPYGGGSVHVRAGISSERRTELVMIENGISTGERYITEILNDNVCPFFVNMGENAVFMQDNARSHRAKICLPIFNKVY